MIGVRLPGQAVIEAENSLSEIENLSLSAGAKVCGKDVFNLKRIDPAFFFTSGKVNQITGWAHSLDADALLIDAELSPAQQRNLEEKIDLKILDRTQIILDIFARRAKSKEGKIQVELAQIKYRLTRLTGKGTVLSRLGGGIGTRGPGEMKLEVDRRRINERVKSLQKEIDKLRTTRATQRKRRLKSNVPMVAIVGYTNAGKSTLLNLLSRSDVFVEDKLFATLDPTIKKVRLSNRQVVFTDTVGFIHKLPATLIAAFRATLEEIIYADLILHVIDSTNPQTEKIENTTHQILHEIGADNKPTITVWNKIDLIEDRTWLSLKIREYSPSVAISAVSSEGVESMRNLIETTLKENEDKNRNENHWEV